jgi:flagella basal body P-ring formation protein FlgA
MTLKRLLFITMFGLISINAFSKDYISFNNAIIRVDNSNVLMSELLHIDDEKSALSLMIKTVSVRVVPGEITASSVIALLKKEAKLDDSQIKEIHWRGQTTARVEINAKPQFSENVAKQAISDLTRLWSGHFEDIDIQWIKKSALKGLEQFSSIKVKQLEKLKPRKRLSVWVQLLDEESQVVGEMPLWFKVSVKKKVLIAKTNLESGEAISSKNVTFALQDVTEKTSQFIDDIAALDNKRLKRKIYKNQPILDAVLEAEPLVKRNKRVIVHYKSDAISMSVEGVALRDGFKGDVIKVKVAGAKQPILVKIVKKNTVVVESINV